MHSTTFNQESSSAETEGEVLVAIATLVREGRIPELSDCGKEKTKGFREGVHSTLLKKGDLNHICNQDENLLCNGYKNFKERILTFYKSNLQFCIEVVFTCACKEIKSNCEDNLDNAYLLEQWYFSLQQKKNNQSICLNINQLVSAIHSQLYFSQITAWLVTQNKDKTCSITSDNIKYRLATPNQLLGNLKFSLTASKHDFPLADIGNGKTLTVSVLSAPRTSSIPVLDCGNCSQVKQLEKSNMEFSDGLLDDRMHTSCTIKGKHRCEEIEENENITTDLCVKKRLCQDNKIDNLCGTSTNQKSKPKDKLINDLPINEINVGYDKDQNDLELILERQQFDKHKIDLKKYTWQNTHYRNRHTVQNKNLQTTPNKNQVLLNSMESCSQNKCVQNCNIHIRQNQCDNLNCDTSDSDIFNLKSRNNFNVYVSQNCDRPIPVKPVKVQGVNREEIRPLVHRKIAVKKRIDFQNELNKEINENVGNMSRNVDPNTLNTSLEELNSKKKLDNIFHHKTGLPLSSSPAPTRRAGTSFEFDSSTCTISSAKRILFADSLSTDDESESDVSVTSPCSSEIYAEPKRELYSPVICRRMGQNSSLLGSFEESVLNGRLKPVSTVRGFTAELGASGSFVPKHLCVPVTVFFYSFNDNEQVLSPYLGQLSLGKKGYCVPKSGTVQVTLFNPLRTVVRMFVVMYDLSDMPPNCQTFIRQRTLYMPSQSKLENFEFRSKWLRYVIHLRFISSKSGKIYLHSDIRMIISKKSDMDTATAHGIDMRYELRSFTYVPSNPKFSPRK